MGGIRGQRRAQQDSNALRRAALRGNAGGRCIRGQQKHCAVAPPAAGLGERDAARMAQRARGGAKSRGGVWRCTGQPQKDFNQLWAVQTPATPYDCPLYAFPTRLASLPLTSTAFGRAAARGSFRGKGFQAHALETCSPLRTESRCVVSSLVGHFRARFHGHASRAFRNCCRCHANCLCGHRHEMACRRHVAVHRGPSPCPRRGAPAGCRRSGHGRYPQVLPNAPRDENLGTYSQGLL